MEKIKKLFEIADIEISDEQAEKFKKYSELLLFYNQKFNLTAITDETEIIIKHFIDSVSGAKFLPENANVIDIGSGAGFPAVPLKIMRPDLKITALDSLNKRVEFIKTVIKELNLESIESVHLRAEEAGSGERRETYDIAVARAVAPLGVLCEYALPLIKVGGIFVAYKGKTGETEEIESAQNAVKLTGGRLLDVNKFMLPDGSERNLVIIKKVAKTDKKYPRKGNKPRVNPL